MAKAQWAYLSIRLKGAPGSMRAMDFHTWLIYLLAAVGLSLSPGPNGRLAIERTATGLRPPTAAQTVSWH